MLALWPAPATRVVITPDPSGKEAHVLGIDSGRAIERLGWRPNWPVAEALRATVEWYRIHANTGMAAPGAMRETSLAQLTAYSNAARAAGIGWAS
jgi:hypothetical protein